MVGLLYRHAYLLEPMLSIDEGDGPMKTMPSSANRLAKFAFSLRKPYLWMEFLNKADENELKTGVILPWMYCLHGSLDITIKEVSNLPVHHSV